MFTGIVEGIGKVRWKRPKFGTGVEIGVFIGKLAEGLKKGDSVALSGVCATIEKIEGQTCVFFLGEETLNRTWFNKHLKPGTELNIERSLRLNNFVGGHMVQGHVDCTGKVVSWKANGGQGYFTFSIDKNFLPFVVEKGSIAVDGVSLTVTNIKDGEISVFLVPYTVENSTLGRKKQGDLVNIETDIIGKYVFHQLKAFKDQRNVDPSI